MLNSFLSVALSIFAAFIYDLIKKAYLNRKPDTSVNPKVGTKEYVASVKKEFYISFFLGILFISIPDTKYEFCNLALDIIGYFSFFVSLMGFMCLVEVTNYFFNKDSQN